MMGIEDIPPPAAGKLTEQQCRERRFHCTGESGPHCAWCGGSCAANDD